MTFGKKPYNDVSNLKGIKKSVIITAGGIGSRMESTIPKQFHLLKGKPIIFHTIQKFISAIPTIEVIVVLPENHIDLWNKLCLEYKFELEVQIILGGEERFYSVKNGLKATNGDLIAIHDAVRPLISEDVIEKAFQMAINAEAVIPVIDLKESIRIVNDENSQSLNRADYKIIQTPQVFQKLPLAKAYEQEYINSFTDDASVVEAAGFKITLMEGNQENIKITTKNDLKIAECMLE